MESPKKNNDFIKKIISQHEGLKLDFKQNLSSQRKIAKTIAAFANTEGGTIVVGVSDKGKLIGIDVDEELYMVEEALHNYCIPPISLSFDIYEIDYWEDEKLTEEKYLLFLQIPKSPLAPHYVHQEKGEPVYYIRVKDRTLPQNTS